MDRSLSFGQERALKPFTNPDQREDMKTAFLLILLTSITGCTSSFKTVTVTTGQTTTVTTTAPARVQAWTSNQIALRETQTKVLDLLIAKEKTDREAIKASNPQISFNPVISQQKLKQEPKSEILNVNIAFKEEINDEYYKITPDIDEDSLLIEESNTPDDSTKLEYLSVENELDSSSPIADNSSSLQHYNNPGELVAITSVNAMARVSSELIRSNKTVDPALAALLNNNGTAIPDSELVAGMKATGGILNSIGGYSGSFMSSLFTYFLVDSVLDSAEQSGTSVSIGGDVNDSHLVLDNNLNGTANSLSIPGQVTTETTSTVTEISEE